MAEVGFVSKQSLSDMQAHPGIGPQPMPIAIITFHLTERFGDLRRGRFDFLQANDVGLIAFDPLENLRLAGANPVHVPRPYLHGVNY
jgi:hypothetical protein